MSIKELMLELWCWRGLLRVPWTVRRSNQSILTEISAEYSLEGLMLKLKFQYFGHRMRRTDSWEKPWCWETVKAGEGDDRRWDGWKASLTVWIWVWANLRSWWWTGKSGVLQSMGLQSRTPLNNWTELTPNSKHNINQQENGQTVMYSCNGPHIRKRKKKTQCWYKQLNNWYSGISQECQAKSRVNKEHTVWFH